MATAGGPADDDAVRVSCPAASTYVPVLRAVISALIADAGFDVDAYADARMAVDEAAETLIDIADPTAPLSATYWLGADGVRVRLECGSTGGSVDQDTFGWRVLTTLTDRLETDVVGDGRSPAANCIEFVKRRTIRESETDARSRR
ncbi:MAG: hypothetical protein ACR2F6_16275 [Mycobacteriales bacterium]